MTKLLDEEIEQDELFWTQDALKEVDCPFVSFSFLLPSLQNILVLVWCLTSPLWPASRSCPTVYPIGAPQL